MAHTHTGTCQLCGREHAINVKTGEIAKHGYTVDYGFFSGTCRGAGYQPLQISREHLDNNIERWEEQANLELAKTAADIAKVPVQVLVTNGAFSSYREKRMMNEEDYNKAAEGVQTPTFAEAVETYLTYTIHRRATGLLAHCEDMKVRATAILGTDLFPVKAEKKNRKVFECYRDAFAFSETLKDQGIKTRIRQINNYSREHGVYWTTAP
jgi:hypothetical protein